MCIQIFRKNGEFVRQILMEPETRGSGSPWDLIPSEDPDQRYLLVADGGRMLPPITKHPSRHQQNEQSYQEEQRLHRLMTGAPRP